MEAIIVLVVFVFLLYWIFENRGLKNSTTTSYTSQAQSEYLVRPQIPSFPRFRVRHVIDGDTIIVDKGWFGTRIRLDSIDCPEDGQEWGDIATFGLIKMIGGKSVHLEEHGVDLHGRTVATLYVWNNEKNEWLNVNERMVTLGHAWVMRLYYGHLPEDRQQKFNRLESWAKSKRVGLWGTENPIPPWQWRKEDIC